MPVQELTSVSEFKSIIKDTINHNKDFIFVDFYTTWCGPCKKIAPVLENMSEAYGDNIYFCKINIEQPELEEISNIYGIASLPTFMIFDKGNFESSYKPIIGANKDVIEARLQSLSKPITIDENNF